MQEKTVNPWLRRAAGILYAALCLFEFFIFKDLFEVYSMVYSTMLFALLYILATGYLAVKCLSSDAPVPPAFSRGVAMFTALIVGKTLVLYSSEAATLTDAFTERFPSLATNDILLYVIIIAQLMLLVVAAFLLLNARPTAEEAEAVVEAPVLAEAFQETETEAAEQEAAEEASEEEETEN